MNEFPSALDHVHATLSELHEQGVTLRASAAALARLENTPTAAPQAPAPLPGPVPAAAARPLSPAPDGSKAQRLAALRGPVLACTLCPQLVKSRTQVVFGVGNPEAEVMFVGEAPGEDEDLQGEPFVGKAGQLLTKIIAAMGFRDRKSVV